jgi:hypothetical protein
MAREETEDGDSQFIFCFQALSVVACNRLRENINQAAHPSPFCCFRFAVWLDLKLHLILIYEFSFLSVSTQVGFLPN